MGLCVYNVTITKLYILTCVVRAQHTYRVGVQVYNIVYITCNIHSIRRMCVHIRAVQHASSILCSTPSFNSMFCYCYVSNIQHDYGKGVQFTYPGYVCGAVCVYQHGMGNPITPPWVCLPYFKCSTYEKFNIMNVRV